jgi:uncharacterized metal-binding protein
MGCLLEEFFLLPSGKVHNVINASSYAVLAGITSYLHYGQGFPIDLNEALRFSTAFWAGTLLLSPDLDLAEQNVSSKKAWGLFGFLWYPYGVLFSHRGLSHTWVIGPLTRLVYLALLLTPVALLISWFMPKLIQWKQLYTPLDQWLSALVGYYLSQWLHLIADGIAPDHGLQRLRSYGKKWGKKH